MEKDKGYWLDGNYYTGKVGAPAGHIWHYVEMFVPDSFKAEYEIISSPNAHDYEIVRKDNLLHHGKYHYWIDYFIAKALSLTRDRFLIKRTKGRGGVYKIIYANCLELEYVSCSRLVKVINFLMQKQADKNEQERQAKDRIRKAYEQMKADGLTEKYIRKQLESGEY
ncbi:MAG: hypothetical protein FWB72_06880 [Firmicutes bacterium]|nr:hypothetical protein [Bacillota bacterium]